MRVRSREGFKEWREGREGKGIAPLGIVQIERKREREKREKDAFVLMAAEGGEERKKGRERATC